MDEQRGGLYFREARFFLAGDRDSALRHIHEARGLMGYMRDMKSLGGPAVQVRYATLDDGTKIKTVLMNGQYQAYIESPHPPAEAPKRLYQLVVAGIIQDNVDYTKITGAFKWMDDVGFVFLPVPDGYVMVGINSISDDGLMVSGVVRPMGVDFITSHRLVYWTSSSWNGINTPTVVGSGNYYAFINQIDVSNNDPTPFIIPPVFNSHGYTDYFSHRFIRGNDHLFMGADHVIHPPTGVTMFNGITVERESSENVIDYDIRHDFDDGHYMLAGVYDSDETGNILVGYYGTNNYPSESYPGMVKWVRENNNSPYVRSIIHPDFPDDVYITNSGNRYGLSISRDGLTIGGTRRRLRGGFSEYDQVPVVYTEQDGVIDLWPLIDPPILNVVQSNITRINSIGTAMVGYGGVGNTHEFHVPVGWEKDDATGLWAVIHDFSTPPFYGMIQAVN